MHLVNAIILDKEIFPGLLVFSALALLIFNNNELF